MLLFNIILMAQALLYFAVDYIGRTQKGRVFYAYKQ
jgi:hypothetical protein